MITGYNTDVEYEGVAYHVQTEDKGLQTPIIISLVYCGGEVLASKRTPYDDLIARGFDERLLVRRLQRQHKLICAAVHAGRIEDLKRMNEGPASPFAREADAVPADKDVARGDDSADKHESEASHGVVSHPTVNDEALRVSLLDEQEFRGGASVILRLLVSRRRPNAREPAPGVRVLAKTLGTSFAPQSTFATTDERGVASISLSLPDFKSGRAAILVQAEENGEIAELRRIILPAKS